jgi:hypothetical protein
MLMTFFDKLAEVLTENPEDFAQAVFSRTGRPQEAKYLFILMLLNDMLNEEMLLTERGKDLVDAVAARKDTESNQSSLMRFMCEDAEFACAHIQPALAVHIEANRDKLSEKSFWRDKTEEAIAQFSDKDQLVRTACYIIYADTFKCSFNEAAGAARRVNAPPAESGGFE